MTEHGLVDIRKFNPHIVLDIKYATDDNFVKRAVYKSAAAYLREDVARKLALVQEALEKQRLGLKVWDAYRPFERPTHFVGDCS